MSIFETVTTSAQLSSKNNFKCSYLEIHVVVVAKLFAASTIDGPEADITRADDATQIAIGYILIQTLCGFLPLRNTHTKKNNGPKMTQKFCQWWRKTMERSPLLCVNQQSDLPPLVELRRSVLFLIMASLFLLVLAITFLSLILCNTCVLLWKVAHLMRGSRKDPNVPAGGVPGPHTQDLLYLLVHLIVASLWYKHHDRVINSPLFFVDKRKERHVRKVLTVKDNTNSAQCGNKKNT